MTYLAVEALRASSPAQWEWLPLRRVSRLRRESNKASHARLLALSSGNGVEPRPDDGGRQLPSDATITGYWLVRFDDLVFNPMWAIGRGVAVSKVEGAVSTAYRVYELGERVYPRFLHYYVRCDPIVDQYRLVVRGLTTFDRSVTREDLEGMPVPLPPLPLQRAIADYLDTETARIDALIEKKHRMVELLDERRTLKISEMLDCTVMDKSIHPRPARRVPLRHLASVHGGLTLGKQYDSAVVSRPYIRVANVQDGHLDLSDIAQIDVPPEVARRHHGDLLLLEGNGNPANLGRGTLWRGELQQCLHQNHVHVVRVDPNLLLPEYLDLVVRSQWARFFFTGESDAVGISTLSQDRIRELPVPVPSIEEQRLLVEAAASQGRKHERTARLLLDQISLLAERRQALITAAVAGELDIPGVAA